MGRKRKNFEGAVELYNKGLSIGDVAESFSMSRQAMWKILKRRGVKFRPQLKFQKDNHFYRGGSLRTHVVLKKLVDSGRLVVGACETCGLPPLIVNGRQRIRGHHDDYNKLTEVRWLCFKCHFEWHRKNKAFKRTLPRLTPSQIGSIGWKAAWSKSREKILASNKAVNLLKKQKKLELL